MSWDEDRVIDMKVHPERYNALSFKQPKELCSNHRSNVIDVTITCSMITKSICTTCGLE